jgi:hypothetical protein
VTRETRRSALRLGRRLLLLQGVQPAWYSDSISYCKWAQYACKRKDFCPCRTFLRREPAVRAVCENLNELIQQDSELIEQVIVSAQRLDAETLNASDDQIARLERQIRTLSNKVDDLIELAAKGETKIVQC